MVVLPLVLLVVVHEAIQVWEVAIEVDISGIPTTHQVAIEFWTLEAGQIKI